MIFEEKKENNNLGESKLALPKKFFAPLRGAWPTGRGYRRWRKATKETGGAKRVQLNFAELAHKLANSA